MRRRWDLDAARIDNIIHLLESNGVRIYSLPSDLAAVGTFSLWHADRPYFLLDRRQAAGAVSLDAACQLGHLLLRRGVTPAERKAEQQARVFTRALLMPADTLKAQAERTLSVDWPEAESHRWNVPVSALLNRLHELGELSDWHFRHLALRGVKPAGSGEDSRQNFVPATLPAVFAALRQRGITRRTLGRELHIHFQDVDQLVFGQASAQLHDEASPERDAVKLRPRLAIVRP